MNRKNFVVTSTVLIALMTCAIVALAVYSNFAVNASTPGLPEAIAYVPGNAQAVFGMNVQKFVNSPVFKKFEAEHGQDIGKDLAEVIDKTGVDPRRDVDYVIAAGKAGAEGKGEGLLIATGRFNRDRIVAFLKTKVAPIELDYLGASVVMIPENGGNKVEKGIAFLGAGEIAVGDLATLRSAIDTQKNPSSNVLSSAVLGPILRELNPDEMFWFAGDPSSVISKAPTNTPLGGSITSIQQVFGTLNLTDAVSGKIVVTARDKESAQKLADVAKGLVALGQLAGDQNPDLTALLKGVSIVQEEMKIQLKINFPLDVLERLQHGKAAAAVKKTI